MEFSAAKCFGLVMLLLGGHGLVWSTPVDDANKLLDAKKYSEAEALLAPLLEAEKPSAPVLGAGVRCYAEQGKYFSAGKQVTRYLAGKHKTTPAFLLQAARVSEGQAEFNLAVSRYKAYLQAADSKAPGRQAALTSLIRLQVLILKSPESAADLLIRSFNDYGFDPMAAWYARRSLDTLRGGSGQAYYELAGKLFDVVPESAHHYLVQHYWDAALRKPVKYRTEAYPRIAEFLRTHKVKELLYATEIMRQTVQRSDTGNPTQDARENRLLAGRLYGLYLLGELPPEQWPGSVVSLTIQGFLKSSNLADKKEGVTKFNELDQKVWKTGDERLYRTFLRAFVKDYPAPPTAEIIAALHKYVEKLGPESVQDELLGLHQIRQLISAEGLTDQAAAEKGLREAIKKAPRQEFVARYLETAPKVNVAEVLQWAEPLSDADNRYRQYLAGVSWLARQKDRAKELDALVRRAVELLPYDIPQSSKLVSAYVSNPNVPPELKAATLSALIKKFPQSSELQKLVASADKWLRRSKKIEAANAIEAAKKSAGAGDAASPWAQFPDFLAAARKKDLGKYQSLLKAFIAKHKPNFRPRGKELTPANVMAAALLTSVPSRAGMKQAQRAELFFPLHKQIWVGPLCQDLSRTRKFKELQEVTSHFIETEMLKRAKPFRNGELNYVHWAVANKFYEASDNTRDNAAVAAMVPRLVKSENVTPNYRVNSIEWGLGRVNRERDNKVFEKYLKETLLALPVAKLVGDAPTLERLVNTYRNCISHHRGASVAVVQRLSELAKASGLSPERWARYYREIAARDHRSVRSAWFKESLGVDVAKLDLAAKRTHLYYLYNVAGHEGWNSGFKKGQRNQITVKEWIPLEQEWLKSTPNPFATFSHPWRLPWEHAWRIYYYWGKKDRNGQVEWAPRITEWAVFLAQNLPLLQDNQLAIAREGALLLAAAGDVEKLEIVLPIVASSVRDKNSSADYLKQLCGVLSDSELQELAGSFLLTAQRANSYLPAAARRTAEILMADLGKDLGIYRIPVDKRAPEYDLYVASQAYVFGDKIRALQLAMPKYQLLVQHWHNLNPEFVVFALNSMRRQGRYAEALDACRRILLSQKYLAPEVAAGLSLVKGDIYRDQEEYEPAVAEYKSLLANKPLAATPPGKDAVFHLIDTYRATGNYESAKRQLDRLLDQPNVELQARAYYFLALISSDQGQIEEAEQHLSEVFKRRATDNNASLLQGELAVRKQQYHRATDLEIGTIAEQKSAVPWKSLKLKISDPNLGVARANDAIPVVVTTSVGKDRELVKLRAKEGNRSVFEGRILTRLGNAEAGNFLLEISGKDKIHYTIEEAFQKANNLDFSPHELVVVSNAKLAASSGEFLSEEERKRRELEQELQDPDNVSRREVSRDPRTIRPGNPVYIQVEDPDRDMGAQADPVTVKIETSSGDVIESFPLTETGPYTGIFQGHAKTGKPLPKASASDTEEGKDAGWAINSKRTGAWTSVPDGLKPKWFELDLQDPHRLSQATIDLVKPDVVRGVVLLGAQFQDDYRVLARFPDETKPYEGGVTASVAVGQRLTSPRDIRLLMASRVDFEKHVNTMGFRLDAIRQLRGKSQDTNIRMHGFFYLDKLMRLSLKGETIKGDARGAIVIDGKQVGGAQRRGRRRRGRRQTDTGMNVILGKGVHEIEVLLSTRGADAHWELHHINDRGEWKLLPGSWFSTKKHPELEAAQKEWAELKLEGAQLTASILNRQRFRKLRLIFTDYSGDMLSIREFKVSDLASKQLVPGPSDFSDAKQNQSLELSAGDRITVTYKDAIRLEEKRPVLTETLDSSYYNAEISLNLEVLSENNRMPTYSPVKRVAKGDNLMVRLTDWDLDLTDEKDVVPIAIIMGDDKPIPFKALETEPHSGDFIASLKFGDVAERDQIALRDGAEILIRYFDEENTDPGTSVDRDYKVFEAGDAEPEIRVLKTSTVWENVVERSDRRRRPSRTRQRVAESDERKVLRKQVIATSQEFGTTAAEGEGAEAAPAEPVVLRTAIDAPVLFFVKSPSAARNELSKASARVYSHSTKAAAEAGGEEFEKLEFEVRLEDLSTLSTRKGFSNVRFVNLPGTIEQERMELGLFAGICKLQLGKPGDAVNNLVITAEAAFGSARAERQQLSQEEMNTVPTIIVQGNDKVTVEIDWQGQVISKTIELYCDGQLHFLDRTFESPKDGFYLGETLFMQVVDYDLDTSDDYDEAKVEISTSAGDRLTVALRETLPHSGIFSGTFIPNYRAKEVPPVTEDQQLSVHFGEEITAVYSDGNHAAGQEPQERRSVCKVFLGSDGLVNTFSKRFKDEEIAVKTAFTIAEGYFELAKEHRKLGKEELSTQEIRTGKRLLEEALASFPNTKFAAQAEYLLANLAQETAKYDEAISSYTRILQHWPDSDYAPKAQFKLGLCYEKMDPPQWNEACEEYVKITYKYPNNPLVADVIIRLGQYFWRIEQFEVAGDVFKSFQDRFSDHKLSSRAMLLSGQSYIKAKMHEKAVEVLNDLVTVYADDKTVRSEAMYWLADSYYNQKNMTESYKTFKNLTWDYPETKWAKMARGRLVEDAFRNIGEKL